MLNFTLILTQPYATFVAAITAMMAPLHHKPEYWATTKLVEKDKQISLAEAKKTIQELEKENNT